jgi:four helix bundle protein
MGHSHRELIAWHKAMDLVMDVYRTTKAFPRDETYALTGQLRRAAVTVATNIADEQADFSANESHAFLGRAREALVEVETKLKIAQDPTYFTSEQGKHLLERAAELEEKLTCLIVAIRPAA